MIKRKKNCLRKFRGVRIFSLHEWRGVMTLYLAERRLISFAMKVEYSGYIYINVSFTMVIIYILAIRNLKRKISFRMIIILWGRGTRFISRFFRKVMTA